MIDWIWAGGAVPGGLLPDWDGRQTGGWMLGERGPVVWGRESSSLDC